MSRVLLQGVVVLLLAAIFPTLLPLLSPILAGLDLSFLSDQVITLGELIEAIGSVLILISRQGREAVKYAATGKVHHLRSAMWAPVKRAA
jgi:hypothetical protein